MAWVFFMLFAVSLCSAMVGFSILHIPFEAAFLLAISAITTTGPLLQSAFAQGVDLAQMSPQVKALYAVVMVLGRLESLALVALLTRDLWGRGSIR
jgi:trk system potassium uptake protein TrkH